MKVCLICFRPESCEHLPSESPKVVTILIIERNLESCVQNIPWAVIVHQLPQHKLSVDSHLSHWQVVNYTCQRSKSCKQQINNNWCKTAMTVWGRHLIIIIQNICKKTYRSLEHVAGSHITRLKLQKSFSDFVRGVLLWL